MIYKGSFDEASVITWQEERPRPPDLGHLQGAMFTDRPDLWPAKRKKARRSGRPLQGETAFAFLTDPMKECQGPDCQKGDPDANL